MYVVHHNMLSDTDSRDVNSIAFSAVRFWKILARTSRAAWLSKILSRASTP